MIGSRLTSKGQMTIPKEIRDYLGLQPGDRVVFLRKDGKIVIEGIKQTLLDLRGSVKAQQRPEDFNKVRQQVKRQLTSNTFLGPRELCHWCQELTTD